MAGECIFSNDEISINDNNILNGIEIKYLREMSKDELNLIKHHGFRWSRKNQFWYAKKNENIISFTKNIIANFVDNDIPIQSKHESVQENYELFNKESDINKHIKKLCEFAQDAAKIEFDYYDNNDLWGDNENNFADHAWHRI